MRSPLVTLGHSFKHQLRGLKTTRVNYNGEISTNNATPTPRSPLLGSAEKPKINILERHRELNDTYNEIGARQTCASPYEYEATDRSAYELTLSKMLAAGLHLGSATKLWNPRNHPFIFGERNGIHIFNLEVTMSFLRRACSFTREVAYRGGIILFVSSKPQYAAATIRAANRCDSYYIYHKWVPGTITNRNSVLRPEYYKTDSGSTETKYYKPDLLILANVADNKTAVAEATRLNIPTIALIDSDQDPKGVTFPIPGNDDSIRGLELVFGLLSASAKDGLVKKEFEIKERKRILDQSKVEAAMATANLPVVEEPPPSFTP